MPFSKFSKKWSSCVLAGLLAAAAPDPRSKWAAGWSAGSRYCSSSILLTSALKGLWLCSWTAQPEKKLRSWWKTSWKTETTPAHLSSFGKGITCWSYEILSEGKALSACQRSKSIWSDCTWDSSESQGSRSQVPSSPAVQRTQEQDFAKDSKLIPAGQELISLANLV